VQHARSDVESVFLKQAEINPFLLPQQAIFFPRITCMPSSVKSFIPVNENITTTISHILGSERVKLGNQMNNTTTEWTGGPVTISKKLTQANAAEILYVSQSRISDLIRGKW
jgi:hypothetical protein